MLSNSLADRGIWINLIRGGEEQSANVREAPVECSKLINTVAVHLGYVCVTKLLKCIKSIKAIQTSTKPTHHLPCFHI